jgi:uncharacterized membrane protein
MIESVPFYLFSIALLATLLRLLDSFKRLRLFAYFPAVVLVYVSAMLLAQLGLWEQNKAISSAYVAVKSHLLPAMLFLMLLTVDLRAFLRLGRPLLIAYFGAVVSISLSFVAVFWLLGFDADAAGVFGALAGSWTGGTANMVAVAAALEVPEVLMGYALVVDSVDYTLWVMLLLAVVGIAPIFNRWSRAANLSETSFTEEEASFMYSEAAMLLAFSFAVAVGTLHFSQFLGGLSDTTWTVLIATLLGLAGSQTRLNTMRSSRPLASAMLFLLVALIGSRASFSGFDAVPIYLLAGALILLLHAAMMVILAKLFRLDLFSIAVASLANIGGVASAPILASAYDRTLIGVAVLMAVMGYLFGTFGGLLIAATLKGIAQ